MFGFCGMVGCLIFGFEVFLECYFEFFGYGLDFGCGFAVVLTWFLICWFCGFEDFRVVRGLFL